MALKTRGSAALDKAQRRLALLKSIENNLDLGYGLTVAAYGQLIDQTRAMLEAHNTLLSEIEESGRMLSGVATRYGRNSMQYLKAGGSNRMRKSQPSQSAAPETPPPTQAA
jgi:hypothetical protein